MSDGQMIAQQLSSINEAIHSLALVLAIMIGLLIVTVRFK